MESIKTRYIPNYLTLLRIIFMFPIVWTQLRGMTQLSFFLFVMAGLSDAVDGFLARCYGWTTRFGSIIDPIADKCLILILLALLVYLHELPAWLLVLIFFRDAWIALAAVLYYFAVRELQVSPPWPSKCNTFLQMLLITVLLFQRAFLPLPAWLIDGLLVGIIGMTLLSFLAYTWLWGKQALLTRKSL